MVEPKKDSKKIPNRTNPLKTHIRKWIQKKE